MNIKSVKLIENSTESTAFVLSDPFVKFSDIPLKRPRDLMKVPDIVWTKKKKLSKDLPLFYLITYRSHIVTAGVWVLMYLLHSFLSTVCSCLIFILCRNEWNQMAA